MNHPDGEVRILSVHVQAEHYRHGNYSRLVWEHPHKPGVTILKVLEEASKRLIGSGKVVKDLQSY